MLPRPLSILLLCGALAAGAAGMASAADTPPSAADQARFFETNIRPLLVTRCQSCHGAELAQGGLRVDSLARLKKGGKRGAALAAGDPAHSLLLQAVRHETGVPAMPPATKLSDREIADLTRWVAMGAPWGDEKSKVRSRVPASRVMAKEGAGGAQTGKSAPREHWAFKRVQRPAVPRVKNAAWVKNPVDAFILARLEAKGLKPAPPADRRTLLRRATFDLTGLPPTPAEVEAFVADGSPDAWEKVVDRLLASPHYGERWGRHWLDVARYADSNGMDENVHYANAWRYRDYVVRSFNEDKPYDRFLQEQIAGDLLVKEKGRLEIGDSAVRISNSKPPIPNLQSPISREDCLTATGFFAIGPKMISEVDDLKVEWDTVDEHIDTLGRTVMGLSLGCARCHDHKFDPVSQRDYYALAGIFKSTQFISVWKKPRLWLEHSLASEAEVARKAEHDRQLAAKKAAIDVLVKQATADVRMSLPAGSTMPKNAEASFPESTRAEMKRLREELAKLEASAPVLPAAMGVTDGKVADAPLLVRGEFLKPADVVPRGVPQVIAGAAPPKFDPSESGRLQLARWLTGPDHPLTGRVLVNRVWRWHFGQGLVRTPDDFGLRGERPTHPELLDWLASIFVSGDGLAGEYGSGGEGKYGSGRNGQASSHSPTPPLPHSHTARAWSLKSLHRLLMLSNTYQMSDRVDRRAAAVDAENRLRWRWEMRRLEAEEIRDAMLAVSGLLDRTMGGTLLTHMKNREYFFDHTSKDKTGYETRRRSIYLPIVRNHLYDVFALFDFGDAIVPEGNRPTSTVAPQALFMLNGPLVSEAAQSLADRLLAEQDLAEDDRYRRLALAAYGRPATDREVARARSILARFEGSQDGESDATKRHRQAWSWLCHVMLASNEFCYIR